MRVLFIEDDDTVRMVVADTLEGEGMDCDAVSNSEDALILMSSGQIPDVLVTDINLGAGLNGIELADNVRSRFPGVAVVFVSGRPSDLNGHPLAKRERFLAKPFTPSELVRFINDALR